MLSGLADFLAQFGQKTAAAHPIGGLGVVGGGEGGGQGLMEAVFFLPDVVIQRLKGGFVVPASGFGQGFSPGHLLHQEFGGKGGVFGGIGLNTVRLQQGGCAVERLRQHAVGFVYRGGHHHGLFLLEGRGGGAFVGVELCGQQTVALLQGFGVEVELFGQAEKAEVGIHNRGGMETQAGMIRTFAVGENRLQL